MITKLIDFYLMKESPLYYNNTNRTEMGNSIVNPKFSPLICTLSTLIRSCFTLTWSKEDLKNNIIPVTSLVNLGQNDVIISNIL